MKTNSFTKPALKRLSLISILAGSLVTFSGCDRGGDNQIGTTDQDETGQTFGARDRNAEDGTQIEVHQPAPQITVRQAPPEIIVEQPDPVVNVQQPEPEVRVQTAQPEVRVEQQEPRIRVEEQRGTPSPAAREESQRN